MTSRPSTFDPTYQTEVSDTVFDTNAGTIADLVEGPDGNLYFVSIFEGTFNEITAPGPFPAGGTPGVGLAAATVGPAVPGQVVTSTPAAGAAAPTASITAPSTYNAGQTISFSGTATDPVDGPLPGYDYTWKVDFIRTASCCRPTTPRSRPVLRPGQRGDLGQLHHPERRVADTGQLLPDHADRHRLGRARRPW